MKGIVLATLDGGDGAHPVDIEAKGFLALGAHLEGGQGMSEHTVSLVLRRGGWSERQAEPDGEGGDCRGRGGP